MNDKEYTRAAKKYRDELCRKAVRYTKDGDSAKDAAQEALIELWEHRDAVPPEKALGYLSSVMYRRLVDEHRRVERFLKKQHLLVPEEVYEMEEVCEYHDETQLALDHLSEQQRTALLMQDLGGYNYKEIAEVMGLEVPQVTGLLYRARVEFKKQYLEYSKRSNTILRPLTFVTI